MEFTCIYSCWGGADLYTCCFSNLSLEEQFSSLVAKPFQFNNSLEKVYWEAHLVTQDPGVEQGSMSKLRLRIIDS